MLARTQEQALAACEDTVTAMRKLPNVVVPFPGGIVHSGSKVSSKYKALMTSTNDAYYPILRGLAHSRLDEIIGSVMEIVVNGVTSEDVSRSIKRVSKQCAHTE